MNLVTGLARARRPRRGGLWRRARLTAAAAITGALLSGLLALPSAVADAASGAGQGLAGPVLPAGQARSPGSPTAGVTFPLHTSGASVVDATGKRVKLDLVNWYGAESPDAVVGGLAYQPVATIVNEVVAMGFDGVRLPWSDQMWETNPVVAPSLVAANPQFAGEHARTVFQQVVSDLAGAGLLVVLDNHTSNWQWCCSDSDGNTLWYNQAYPESAWLADWQSMARTFQGVPQVIGADLRNEPRGAATWGGADPATDWHAAAQRGGDVVLGVDPHWLVFVEGTNFGTDLSGAATLPVTLSVPNQVVYSAHDYSFDHSGVTSYDGWAAQTQPKWGYLAGKLPLFLGEFGTCNTSGTCVDSQDSADAGLWFNAFSRYVRYHDLDWAYWPLNGTQSGGLPGQGRTYGAPETYGLLNTAWDAPALPLLLSSVQAMQSPCASVPLPSGTYVVTNRHSGDVIDIPGGSATQGNDLDQWPSNGGANQRWAVTSLGCGLYTVTSVADGESVDISGQSTGLGAKVDQWDYWGGGNQQFLLSRDAAGYFTITDINSLDVVEVPGYSVTAGTLLDQWGPNGGTNQQWSFTPGTRRSPSGRPVL